MKLMTLFDEILPEFLDKNVMPRNKTELNDFCQRLFKDYQNARVKNSRKLSSEEAKEMAQKAVQKRWGNIKKD